MYSYIKGSLEEVYEDRVVVENNGIGYNIFIPGKMLDILPAIGSEVKIYTYLNVREDAFQLFGFESQDELSMFKLLITVSGIGPKGGLGILSILSANDLRFAIVSDDSKTISKAPGVGPKTAKRLIVELKDKIDLDAAITGLGETSSSTSSGAMHKVKQEAVEALTTLGYSASEANQVLKGIEVDDDTDVETVLKIALKNMAFL